MHAEARRFDSNDLQNLAEEMSASDLALAFELERINDQFLREAGVAIAGLSSRVLATWNSAMADAPETARAVLELHAPAAARDLADAEARRDHALQALELSRNAR